MDRRNFLRGLIATPAIVKIDSIMPVKLFNTKRFAEDDTFLVWYFPYVPLTYYGVTEIPDVPKLNFKTRYGYTPIYEHPNGILNGILMIMKSPSL